MNEILKPTDNFTRLGRYSLLFSLLGASSYMIAFPSGIYYGFLAGVIGATGGFLSRPYTEKRGRSTAAIIIGIIDIAICAFAFHGIHTLFSSLKDPVLGPQVQAFVISILQQYGVSIETFSTLMHS